MAIGGDTSINASILYQQYLNSRSDHPSRLTRRNIYVLFKRCTGASSAADLSAETLSFRFRFYCGGGEGGGDVRSN